MRGQGRGRKRRVRTTATEPHSCPAGLLGAPTGRAGKGEAGAAAAAAAVASARAQSRRCSAAQGFSWSAASLAALDASPARSSPLAWARPSPSLASPCGAEWGRTSSW